eukprot:3164529-Amphidinium_carterae.1
MDGMRDVYAILDTIGHQQGFLCVTLRSPFQLYDKGPHCHFSYAPPEPHRDDQMTGNYQIV